MQNVKNGRFLSKKAPNGAFSVEQVTRVELAGNSLGSCRHTARRHLHLLFVLYYISFS